MNYQIKLFSELDEELKRNWLNVEKDSDHTCFNSLVWLENYISSYKEIRNYSKLRIFIIFFDNKPVCVFPFEIINKFKINILQWACDLKSDFNAPVQKKNFNFERKSFEILWGRILKMMPEIDIIYLKKQINFSKTLNNPFINFLKNSREGIIYQINLPNKWENYVNQNLKKKFYFDLMRTKKLMKKSGKVEFVIANNSEKKKELLDVLIRQKNEKLLKTNINSLDKSDLNFYKNFEKYENRKYVTQVSGIKLNGEFIAMHWGIVDNNYFYYLLPSMKETSVKKFSPGKLLLSLLIRWSISKKLKFFDFGLGEESYKSKWSNKTVHIYNHISLNRSKGILFYLALKARYMIKYLKNKT